MTFADVAATWGLPVNQSVSDKGDLWWYCSVPNESDGTHRRFVAMIVFDNNGGSVKLYGDTIASLMAVDPLLAASIAADRECYQFDFTGRPLFGNL